MNGDGLTKKAREVIKNLLAEHGITRYEVVPDSPNEGSLPGSPFEANVSAISGWIVTETQIYFFWLDWLGDHYTLGHEDGMWKEVKVDELSSDDKELLLRVQRQVRERGDQ